MSRTALTRAGDAAKILDFSDELTGNQDPDQAVAQLLCRILHYCDMTSRDWDLALNDAMQWFEADLKE